MPSPFSAIRSLSDGRLLRELENLAQQDRTRKVDLLVHIAEVDTRKLYLVAGYPSLFHYLFQGLRMSDHAAYNRMQVARAARKYPAILERIRDGRLHLTGARVLAPHLTDESCLELLERAKHKPKRQIEALVADLDPRPDAPDLVRRLRASPEPARALDPAPAPRADVPAPGRALAAPPAAPAPTPHPVSRPPEPLGRDRFVLRFTVDRELVCVLEEVQSLLRHQVPDGNLREVFGLALRRETERAART